MVLEKALTEQWHSAPHRWGHPWHAMCSYMAMFPPTIPRVFIEWLTSPGDVVYDPFSGRGTTILEACNSRRIGLGSDASPLAWVLSSAKASPPNMFAVRRRLCALRRNIRVLASGREPSIIREVFHPTVLGQLLWLQEQLSLDSKVDRYLLAVLLGVLHLNARRDGTPRGLSIPMPNTFAMSPHYVSRYREAKNLRPPVVNVIDVLEARIEALGAADWIDRSGRAWLQDASKPIRYPTKYARPMLVFGSPPYLGVMRYAKMNWLRMWLLGQDPKVIDERLFCSGSLPKYKAFMTATLAETENILARGGRICMVIGDVRHGESHMNLAGEIAESCIKETGLKVDAIIDDPLPIKQKVSRIWRERKGRATETDRVLVLSRRRTGRLPPSPRIDWGHA